jgi:hypothetical protein
VYVEGLSYGAASCVRRDLCKVQIMLHFAANIHKKSWDLLLINFSFG